MTVEKKRKDDFERALSEMLRRPSADLTGLQKAWPTEELKKAKRQLAEKISGDPISEPVDLLSPLQGQFDENLHTRALAYLLDERKPHGFVRSVLIGVVDAIKKRDKEAKSANSNAAKILALLHRRDTTSTVIPEYRYAVEGASDRKVARCDIWIEIESKESRGYGLVIIENKINAPLTDQLRWYEKESAKWCLEHDSAIPLLILLSKEDMKGPQIATSTHEILRDRWTGLRYLDLATILRKIWIEKKSAFGSSWLGLYIGTVMRATLGEPTLAL